MHHCTLGRDLRVPAIGLGAVDMPRGSHTEVSPALRSFDATRDAPGLLGPRDATVEAIA
jgi:hypothetical protein